MRGLILALALVGAAATMAHAQGAIPDLKGTWTGKGKSVVFGTHAHHPGTQTPADPPRVRDIEATSFVSPNAVPQLADADELMKRLLRRPGVRYPVLVPNERGLERALAVGADEVAVFVSASESYSRKNLRRGRDDATVLVATGPRTLS